MPLSKSKLKPQLKEFRFEAIGTSWVIEISGKVPPTLITAIKKRIAVFDANYSRFRSDSLVSTMARSAGKYKLPSDAKPLLDLYLSLYKDSDGLVTPLVGQLLSDAGYDANYSLKPGDLADVPSWESVIEYDHPYINVLKPVLLDFGAAGKGYLVDIVAQLIIDAGIQDFSINAGGDILYRQVMTSDARVGLEHPDDPEQVIGVASIFNQSICGSASNRRVWDKYHHIFNPKLKRSTSAVKAVWVVAGSTMLADGLSTALFFMPASKLKNEFTFEYALVKADNSLQKSEFFPAEFF